jgi:hypothetical protein
MPAIKHNYDITELNDDENKDLVYEYDQLNKKFDSVISKIKVRKNKKRKQALKSEVK